MSDSDGPRVQVASVGELDEKSGNLVQSTMRYATSAAASPRKERSNTGKSLRRAAHTTDSSSSTQLTSAGAHTDSDSTLHPHLDRRPSRRNGKEREKHMDKDGERDRRAVVSMQPAPSRCSATAAPRGSSREQDSRYFGVPSPATMTAAPASPRHARPPRHTMPPPTHTRFYPPVVLAQPAMYYPPPPMWGMPGHAMGYPVQPQAIATARPLEDRFGAHPTRPKSALGQKPLRPLPYEDTHEGAMTMVRRGSISNKRVGEMETTRHGRPRSARPAAASPFGRPPPPTLVRKAVLGWEEDDGDGAHDLFQDISPQPRRTYTPAPPSTRSQSRSRRPSVDARSYTYDVDALRTEVVGPSRRRHSYYAERAAAPGKSGYEDQIAQAKMYQQDVDGAAANLPLTDGNLLKASRHGGSSRSTKSSGSHDESEYRRSATTRTTRSSAENEDVTIRVKGHTTLMVGGAEMHCQDGAEINISQRGGASHRGGSDESSYPDHDDGRPRMDRALGGPGPRTHASSQAGSYSRASYSVYDGGHAHHPYGPGLYDVALSYPSNHGYYGPVPPYPAYPGTGSYDSTRGGYL